MILNPTGGYIFGTSSGFDAFIHLRYILYIISSNTIDEISRSLKCQPVIPRTPPVHLELTTGSSRTYIGLILRCRWPTSTPMKPIRNTFDQTLVRSFVSQIPRFGIKTNGNIIFTKKNLIVSSLLVPMFKCSFLGFEIPHVWHSYTVSKKTLET